MTIGIKELSTFSEIELQAISELCRYFNCSIDDLIHKLLRTGCMIMAGDARLITLKEREGFIETLQSDEFQRENKITIEEFQRVMTVLESLFAQKDQNEEFEAVLETRSVNVGLA